MDLAAMALQLLGGTGILRGVGAPDADVGAGLGKCVGHAETDAAIAAGDQRHLARQIEAFVGHATSPSVPLVIFSYSSPPLGGEVRRGGFESSCNPLSQPLPLAGERSMKRRAHRFMAAWCPCRARRSC